MTFQLESVFLFTCSFCCPETVVDEIKDIQLIKNLFKISPEGSLVDQVLNLQ